MSQSHSKYGTPGEALVFSAGFEPAFAPAPKKLRISCTPISVTAQRSMSGAMRRDHTFGAMLVLLYNKVLTNFCENATHVEDYRGTN